MRFVKRYRTRSLWGRSKQAVAVNAEPVADGLGAGERAALLGLGTAAGDESADSGANASSRDGDPTQRLLTTLGRFQRHVALAAAGVPQEEWAEDCMDELVAALDISLEEKWTEVVEALAGTGRLLQSYSEPGYAHLCVPLLADSYDILCLMVGDLIVSGVRPSVMQKWCERYERAVAELQAAGLPLAEDDGAAAEVPYAFAPMPPQIHKMQAAEQAGLSVEDISAANDETPDDAAIESEKIVEEYFSLASVLPQFDEEIETTKSEETPPAQLLIEEAPPEESAGAAQEDGFSFDVEDENPSDEFHEEPIPLEPVDEESTLSFAEETPELLPHHEPDSLGLEADLPPEEETETTPEPSECDLSLPEESVVPEETDAGPDDQSAEIVSEGEADQDETEIDPDVEQALDGLCDALVMFENEDEDAPVRAAEAVGAYVTQLGAFARRKGYDAAWGLCELMTQLCDAAKDPGHARDDRFLELAYGFCETYVVANSEPGSAMVTAWHQEGAELLGRWAAPPAPDPPLTPAARTHPKAAPPPDDRPLKALLMRVQREVAEGNVASAKELTLEAAVSLTRVEVAKAEADVAKAETALRALVTDIEKARDALRRAELQVTEVLQRCAEHKRSAEAAGVRAAHVVETRKEIERHIAQLDARIRELQMQRETEMKHMFEAGIELDEARQQETASQRMFAGQADAEHAARENLEQVRQGAKTLLKQRAEIESVVGQARDQLTKHRASLAGLEQGIAEIRAGRERSDSDGFLF